MTKIVYLIGVDDPEMRAIERLLWHAGVCTAGEKYLVSYAIADGRRVHPGNAYAADPIELGAGDTLVRIECQPREIAAGVKVVVIDHHRDGDPGYGLPPAQYWEASSLGQLHRLLEENVSLWPSHKFEIGMDWPANAAFGTEIVPALNAELGGRDVVEALAAMDHCFAAAVRGECQKVVRVGPSPEEVLAVKCREIATSTKATEEAVRSRIEFFRAELAKSPEEAIGEQIVRDLRRHDLGFGWSLDLLTAQVAATIDGHCALLRHRDRADGPEKNSITGHFRPETIRAFLEAWAPAHGLEKMYGSPARGYAGGYVKA